VDTVLGHVLTWPFLFVAKAIAEGSTTKVFDKVHMNRDFIYIDNIVNGVQVYYKIHQHKKKEKRPAKFQR
jgi:nucleoside-diphosphate-sugar epimerase